MKGPKSPWKLPDIGGLRVVPYMGGEVPIEASTSKTVELATFELRIQTVLFLGMLLSPISSAGRLLVLRRKGGH